MYSEGRVFKSDWDAREGMAAQMGLPPTCFPLKMAQSEGFAVSILFSFQPSSKADTLGESDLLNGKFLNIN